MDCKSCAKLLDDYATETLSPDLKVLVDSHLTQCGVCQGLLEKANRLSRSITDVLQTTTGMLRLRPDVENYVVGAMENKEGLFAQYDMMELFETLTFREKIEKIMYGLKQPEDTGDYKWAKLQMKRMMSPIAGVVVPLLLVCLLALLAGLNPRRERVVNVRIMEPDMIEELEEPEDIPEPEIEPPDPEDIVEPTDNFIPSTSKNQVGPDVDFSPQPAQFDSVAIIKSPVIMKGIFGSRSPGARGSALGKYGGGGHTEGAVLRALRWLKKHQESNGSWTLMSGGGDGKCKNTGIKDGAPVGITGLGLLTFLAHGETPASPEFGKTVECAIKYLVSVQNGDGTFQSKDGRKNYSHPIGTYALCEAFALTKLPTVKNAAEKAMDVILRGMHPTGTWDYNFKQSTRKDITYASWCSQAMKAGKMAGLQNEGLDAAMKKAIDGFKGNYTKRGEYGSFGYTGPSKQFQELTGAAVLCMQLLGGAQEQEAQNGLQWLKQNIKFDWQNPPGACPIYYWYYITQAMFHEGGETWRNWNKQFSVPMVKAQTIVPKAIKDLNGKMVDIGYWKPATEKEWAQSFAYNTVLCALQLQVYYRYLPTFQKPEELAAEAQKEAEKQGVVEAQDLDIDIQL